MNANNYNENDDDTRDTPKARPRKTPYAGKRITESAYAGTNKKGALYRDTSRDSNALALQDSPNRGSSPKTRSSGNKNKNKKAKFIDERKLDRNFTDGFIADGGNKPQNADRDQRMYHLGEMQKPLNTVAGTGRNTVGSDGAPLHQSEIHIRH